MEDEEVQADVDIIVMQTTINLNADSEWDGIAQTMKKSFVKVQMQAEANQKELKKLSALTISADQEADKEDTKLEMLESKFERREADLLKEIDR